MIGSALNKRAWMALAVCTLCACARTVAIGEITKNPREYTDQRVTVEGDVGEVFSLIVVKFFEIDDGTGSIHVVTAKTLPKKGQKIRVTGTVKEAFSLGEQSLTVLLEDGGKN
ncbi:MAG: hypothetical protein ACREUA_02535 [Burkholderiales bacterium]